MKKQELLKALKQVIPGVGKDMIPGADSFLFDKDWIRTYSDTISISYPFKSEINCSIKANEFFKVLQKMKSDEIEMELKSDTGIADNLHTFPEGAPVSVTRSALIVRDDITELKMNLIESQITSLIESLGIDAIEWKKVPKDFITGISKCLFSVSSDVSLGVLCGLFIGGNDIISSDNYRASWFEMDKKMDSFILPLEALNELIKFEDIKEYGINESWVHFRNEENVIFSSRLIEGEFPSEKIKEFFEVSGDEYSFPDELSKSLDRVDVMAFEKLGTFSYISLEVFRGKLVVKGERDFGSIKDKLKIEKDSLPEDFKLMISASFLKSVLEKNKSFYYKGSSVLFDSGDFKHIIATVDK